MARQAGSANFAGTLEVLAGGPLDARSVVATKADLTASDSFPYSYEGMVVYVKGEKKSYTLIGSDTTVASNWKESGSGSGGNERELTQAEYNALTEAEKLNGTTYFIKDGRGSGDAGAGVPDGGTTGQVLTKLSDIDGDADWQDPTGGVTDDMIAPEFDATASYERGDLVWYEDQLYVSKGTYTGAWDETKFELGDLSSIFQTQFLRTPLIVGSLVVGNVEQAISGINNLVGAKQSKTLDTAITINGTQITTVEGALGAINTAMVIGNEISSADIQKILNGTYS